MTNHYLNKVHVTTSICICPLESVASVSINWCLRAPDVSKVEDLNMSLAPPCGQKSAAI